MKKLITICAVATIILPVSSVSLVSAAYIETVPVGNLGNAADSTGYGAVDYAYNIGTYEVTAGVPTNNSVLVGGQGLASFPLRPAPD